MAHCQEHALMEDARRETREAVDSLRASVESVRLEAVKAIASCEARDAELANRIGAVEEVAKPFKARALQVAVGAVIALFAYAKAKGWI